MPTETAPEKSKEAPSPTPPSSPEKEAPASAPPEDLNDGDLDTMGEEAFGANPAQTPAAKVVKQEETDLVSNTDKTPADSAKSEAKDAPKAETESKTGEAKAETPAPAAAPVKETFRGAKEMRLAIEARDKRLSSIQSERDTLANKIKEIETRLEEATKGGDVRLLSEQLQERESRLKQLSQTLAEHDYSRSSEFEQKFTKPFMLVKNRALREVNNLSVTVGDADPRPASPQDFETLMAMPLVQAHRVARQAFGEDSDIVIRHLDKLHEIREDSHAAMEEHKSSYEAKAREQWAQQKREAEQIREQWGQTNQELVKTGAELYGEHEGDEEGNEALKQGFNWIDNAISTRDTMTPKERITNDSLIRLKAGAFDRMKLQRDRFKSEVASITSEKEQKIAELEERIKELSENGPGPSRREGEGSSRDQYDPDAVTPEMAGFER